MTNTIKPGLTPAQLAVPARTPNAAAGSAGQAPAAAPVRGTADSVRITDSAKALDAASRGEGVDTARVEAIRARLAEGTYKPDAQAIASKFLAMEGQIGGKA
ncbi:flagellar biosynthesis anti-sigma factor FlgM [Luteibacter sp. PPL201]|uniref:Negative regulator of flagellin synthesis n=1 Tax=Luteibacter sahnii TaxID=3021977 RepID=A0ABT6BAL3_9GAMM|nr:flagellar biosynthesis anti-sigma factor FlgM [Luteibacter sp. PPL193]MDY1547104.1 flagellar biosynthesis anti-sigma factor FlgM [Luteibacter sp. PPL193]